ncbi:MAG: hypothetical protein J0L82_15900 [Deltaproteobacteria bacterium]|nr:hypothetical protein [Deltaproteobacteria bacterium]
MKRRTFMKFLSLAPAATLFHNSEALASNALLPTRRGRPNPTLVEALNLSPPNRTELVVIAGTPCAGKSTFMLNLLDRFTFERNERSIYFSLECSRNYLISRWRQISLYPHTFKAQTNVDIYDTHRASPKNIWTVVQASQTLNPDLRYVFIDYLQLMPCFEDGKEKTNLADAILRELKRMAVELNITVILAAQLNRGPESKTNSGSLRGVTDSSPIDHLVTIHRDYPSDEVTIVTHRPD